MMAARQRWRSLGHVHVAAGEAPTHMTHATYPTPLALPDGRLRVFFSPRDSEGRSTIFSFDLSLDSVGFKREGAPEGPWLEPGPPGAFDDAGTSVSWVGWTPEGGIDCWYLGWALGVSVPFRTAIGRAHAGPGERRMTRFSFAPALDRDAIDPLSVGYPWLLTGPDRWSIWYGTHRCPPQDGRAIDHVIRRARSADGGATWRRDTAPALAHETQEEWAQSRPSVVRDAAGWHMWYGRRFETYRIGYAHSADGVRWIRADEAVSFVAPAAEWEQGGRAYPAVFDHAGRRWMLYNGAGYGRTGFGLAVLEPD
jgi:hypothetical protein